MRTFDLSPFLHSAIGFDSLFDRSGLTDLDATSKAQSFPPYNIEKLDEDAYRITMALAGFTQDDLTVTVEGDTLIIEGKASEQNEQQEKNYLHKGIAKRAFERQFQLADNIKVIDADFEHGLLNVELVREVPEHKKPRIINLAKTKTLKHDAA